MDTLEVKWDSIWLTPEEEKKRILFTLRMQELSQLNVMIAAKIAWMEGQGYDLICSEVVSARRTNAQEKPTS
jgi:hypothetical protein